MGNNNSSQVVEIYTFCIRSCLSRTLLQCINVQTLWFNIVCASRNDLIMIRVSTISFANKSLLFLAIFHDKRCVYVCITMDKNSYFAKNLPKNITSNERWFFLFWIFPFKNWYLNIDQAKSLLWWDMLDSCFS